MVKEYIIYAINDTGIRAEFESKGMTVRSLLNADASGALDQPLYQLDDIDQDEQ